MNLECDLKSEVLRPMTEKLCNTTDKSHLINKKQITVITSYKVQIIKCEKKPQTVQTVYLLRTRRIIQIEYKHNNIVCGV